MAARRFTIEATSETARAGHLLTPHGTVATPAFCPLTPWSEGPSLAAAEIQEIGGQIQAVNALDVALRPGSDAVRALGGIHGFLSWDAPILSDQSVDAVLDRGGPHGRLHRVDRQGALLASPLDGSRFLVTPKSAMETQEALGADLVVTLSPPGRGSPALRAALYPDWLEQSVCARTRQDQAVLAEFPPSLQSTGEAAFSADLCDAPLDGYALSSIPDAQSWPTAADLLDRAPTRLRYLRSASGPADVARAIAAGFDLVGSAAPFHLASQGIAYAPSGHLLLAAEGGSDEFEPIDGGCACYACMHFSRAYLHHLVTARELLGYRLVALHNVAALLNLAHRLRAGILLGRPLHSSRGS